MGTAVATQDTKVLIVKQPIVFASIWFTFNCNNLKVFEVFAIPDRVGDLRGSPYWGWHRLYCQLYCHSKRP